MLDIFIFDMTISAEGCILFTFFPLLVSGNDNKTIGLYV